MAYYLIRMVNFSKGIGFRLHTPHMQGMGHLANYSPTDTLPLICLVEKIIFMSTWETGEGALWT